MRFSRADSEKYGLAQRNHLGRAALAELKPRSFDPVEVFRQSCAGRIPKLLPVKFKLMSSSPFAFFRGSVEIMAADLGATKNTRIDVQLCGDAHLKNFGFFATPGSEIILDINDFDETIRGPWEWDVKRMGTSIILAGRMAGNKDALCREAAEVFAEEYCEWIHKFAAMPTLEVARHRTMRDLRDPCMRSALKQAERSTPLSNLEKLTQQKNGSRRFILKKDSLWEIEGRQRKAVLRALEAYRATLAPDRQMLFDRYRPVDVGFKVVGTGSVGTRDYVVLLLGRDENDPLFLQVKEEPPSAYVPYVTATAMPSHQGKRVVEGQRALQVQSDLLLGWCSLEGRDYVVRQLSDHKGSVEPEELQGERLAEYSSVCAELLAKGHARSGHPVAIAAYIGNSGKAERALVRFALAYADQVEKDFEIFRKALRRGLLKDAGKPPRAAAASSSTA
ncbi:MAG TPA: DUF2252 domain-containing protein [Candidatus Angelobacter sp.]|nr:DUF2252 domain-containing protein [Candidatus Angelobacter sp.]